MSEDVDSFLPAYTEFGGSYTHSQKEPDLCITPVGMTLPMVAFEPG